jgi:integrase
VNRRRRQGDREPDEQQRPGEPGLRIHDLRHTAVALRIAAGASPKEVAVRAGHTSTSFVLDRYGHLFPSRTRRSATAWTSCSCP